MEFNLKWFSIYAELTVTGSNFSIESGCLNEQEQIELAKRLREIADHLYVEETV
jgi:hypothetical protein